jgi:hypothetical protein
METPHRNPHRARRIERRIEGTRKIGRWRSAKFQSSHFSGRSKPREGVIGFARQNIRLRARGRVDQPAHLQDRDCVGLSGQVQRDFSLSKKAFWPLQAPFTRIWFFQTTFPKWPCSISGSVYNLAVQWLALPRRINRDIAAPVIPASLVRLC